MPLYALADHLKLKRIAVVCHAVGGHVRIKYALQKPGNPSQLALVCTGARFLGGDEERGGFSTEFWARLRESMKKRRIDANADLIGQVLTSRQARRRKTRC